MSFPNMTTSYGKNGGSGESHNPYARAAAAWDERIGSARVQARNWRYIAFASMAIALISTSGAVVLGVKKQVATYVVEVDKAGMPGRITLASEPYQPATAQVGYFVGEVVRSGARASARSGRDAPAVDQGIPVPRRPSRQRDERIRRIRRRHEELARRRARPPVPSKSAASFKKPTTPFRCAGSRRPMPMASADRARNTPGSFRSS